VKIKLTYLYPRTCVLVKCSVSASYCPSLGEAITELELVGTVSAVREVVIRVSGDGSLQGKEKSKELDASGSLL
jgi:hypothetical protein